MRLICCSNKVPIRWSAI